MVYRAAVVTALALALCHGRVWAQTISLLPDQVSVIALMRPPMIAIIGPVRSGVLGGSGRGVI